MIARLLGCRPAGRLTPSAGPASRTSWPARPAEYTPTELHTWGTALVEPLDQDGAEPDDRPPPEVNELHLTPPPDGGGEPQGPLRRRRDVRRDRHRDRRPRHAAAPATTTAAPAERQAEALAEVCGYVLDHGATSPDTGGRPPAPQRAHPARRPGEPRPRRVLDFGGRSPPESLRMLCCDAAVVPDRAERRRASPSTSAAPPAPSPTGCAGRSPPGTAAAPTPAATARRRGAKFTISCDWEHGGRHQAGQPGDALPGPSSADPFHSDWIVRIRDGLPEFIPPKWIDPRATPTPTSPAAPGGELNGERRATGFACDAR